MLLLQIPSLRRKQGSLTTDSRESCLMMLFSLSVFRFWYISWLRSWRKWLTLGLVGLPGRPPVVLRPWAWLLDMESLQPLARSRQQLQQSRPMGERQSSSDISEDRWIKRKDARAKRGRCRNLSKGCQSLRCMNERQNESKMSITACVPHRDRQAGWTILV